MEITRSEQVFQLTQEIQQFQKRTILDILEIGKRLQYITKNKLYRDYATHITTFDEFLKEIRIGRTTGYNCIAIYETYGDSILNNSDLASIDYTRLVKLLPYAKGMSAQDVDSLLIDMADNTIEGFENNIKESQGKPTTDNCPHEEIIVIEKCNACQKTWKIGRKLRG